MPRIHVPVLAGELIEALDPRPGQVAIDCTLGAAGHARLVADRLGASGTLIAIDRDPLAEKAFAELAAEVACDTRFIRADFEHGLRTLCEEGVKADMAYLDLGMSSMQVDTRERGFSYAYDAPLDMRMDPDQPLTAHEIVNTWDRRRLARMLR
ncbi:MAG TPA: 16S rRNA (cytosine(1402)-N(4))-methyltransferase, partial [Solirubrobacteraceae bacterium]|nr:16S rRNA (cytosine(1402)-N(4))-methyltransferase [Solirubrobacteraceae bacterium]